MSTAPPPSPWAGARPPLAVIAGPTGSGKSDLAVRLALDLRARGRDAVVINADSAQVYADLRVLSARPSREEMRRVPHRLYGVWDGARACSAAAWAAAAAGAVAEAHAAGAAPIVVGGSGLYLRTLLDGIAPLPPIDPAVRAAVRALPVAQAHAALTREDPARAAALAPCDSARIARALEVVRATGRPLAAWQARRQGGIGAAVTPRPLVLLPARAALHARCDARLRAMFARGAIDEVAALLARGLDPALPVMRAIGVREIAGYLRGEWPLAEAERRAAAATRRYGKRQVTWLRHQTPPGWPRVDPDAPEIVASVATLCHDLSLTGHIAAPNGGST